MTSFAPACAPISTVVRRFSRYLLMVPLCMLLVGCDSASSNDNKEVRTEVVPVESLEDFESRNAAEGLSDDSNAQSNANSELDVTEEGQSLIAAAQSVNDTHTHQSLMSSELPSSSTLQATLMGDYGGMVPCQSCASIDVTLNLFADGSVLKTSIYNHPEKPQAPLVESGVYRQDNNKITIVYENKSIETYHIQDNHLVLMDEYKNPNNDYILARK
ncbi:hypothetical protein M917_0608 [Psychrobacter aquaticus CMS 56]|uniref:Copper homeostasis protein n=2 Tax=Psychrobacter TaxID=497 RepID=U4T5F7_9GAMM|nr:hypothetical protein M917_0608 [Psychrobacter aquaticus CMS 56]